MIDDAVLSSAVLADCISYTPQPQCTDHLIFPFKGENIQWVPKTLLFFELHSISKLLTYVQISWAQFRKNFGVSYVINYPDNYLMLILQ